jgi:hypothetical protein
MKNEYLIKGEITEIYLGGRGSNKKVCIIDTEDLEKLKLYDVKYYAVYCPCNKQYYCNANIKSINTPSGKTTLKTARIILNCYDENIFIDHKNHNTLDNRKCNLRMCSISNNSRHRKGINVNNKSGYRNVSWIRGQWVVQLQVNGKNTKLGKFDNIDEAGDFAKEMREKFYGVYKGN